MSTKAIIEQLLKERLKPEVPVGFNLKEICFPEQYAFVADTHPWVIADCSRRAGKSVGCAADLLNTCASNPKINCAYITLTRAMAERLVWKELLDMNDKYGFGAVPNKSKLTLTFPNKSVIYLSGCNTVAEIERFRGMALKLVYIDEVQSFKPFIESLINDVIAPALMDYAGSLKMIGTPAPLKRGYFWQTLNSGTFSRHRWTFFQNPHIAIKSKATHQEMLNRELKRRGVTAEDPTIRREYFGEWVDDTNALVCQYDLVRNHYDKLPPIISEFVIGVDIGFNDADAIAVLGWNKNEKICYLMEEIVTPGQGITELAAQIETVVKKYNPLKVVIDQGGLGKKVAEELRKRFSLPITGAEKSRKQEYIALMNDAFRTNQFFAKRESRFAQDSQIIEWDFDKCTPEKKVIKHDPHSDIFDAVLYAYREAIHWLSEPVKQKEDPIKNWAKISEMEAYAKMEADEAKKEWEEKEMDYWNQIDGYDPFLTDQENAINYYVNKKKGEL
jgi:hypothetical protein